MINMLHLFFAGLGPMFRDFSIGSGLIALAVLGALYSPIARKDFIYAALIVGTALLLEARGIRLEHNRVAAQEQAVQVNVDNAVEKSNTPAAKASRDPWDRKDY